MIPAIGAYRGRNRVVLVFASSRTNESYLKQKQLFGAVEDGFNERDLLVFYVFSDEASGETDADVKSHLSVSEAAFTVVLIGKDGGEKERFLKPVEPAGLFSVIDQMPMRRHEVRRKG